MRTIVLASITLGCVLVALAAPAPEPAPAPAPAPAPQPAPQPDPYNDDRPEIIEIIAPAESAQETLATLNLGAPGSELSERNKRTIGILRQLFPTLTQIIEQKVQEITSAVLKVFGPVFIRLFLANNNNGPKNMGGGTIELADDDEDDDDEPVSSNDNSTTSTSTTTSSTTTASSSGAEAARRKRSLYFVPNVITDDNQLLNGAESQQAEVRVAFGEQQQQHQSDLQEAASEALDQQAAAQNNAASIDEITLDDADDTEENRNKRPKYNNTEYCLAAEIGIRKNGIYPDEFLSFGGSGGASGGGSGNFLFDIIRRPAEAMARAAGTAFRVFAGTDSLNLGLSASHTATLDPNSPQLVAGSSSSSGGDSGGAGALAGGDEAGKGDNLTEGVPGPITRLFIIANRGIANLIQDLILRLAQTSERIVNFKARLITSII